MANRGYLLLSIFFAVIVASALFILGFRSVIDPLANIMMFLAGLFTMASLSAFHRFLEESDTPYFQITFNEQAAASQIETAAKRTGVDVVEAEIVTSPIESGDISTDDLLGQDSSLALAKLRIDIERELRQLAKVARLNSASDFIGIRRLTEELAKRHLLDNDLIGVINNILPAANQAIHGGEVPTETAAAIVRQGKQLIVLLRATLNKIQKS